MRRGDVPAMFDAELFEDDFTVGQITVLEAGGVTQYENVGHEAFLFYE
jgi:hypothetical protein